MTLQASEDKMLLFLKPDAVVRRYVGARILKEVTKLDPTISVFKNLSVPKNFLAETHYRAHQNKFFFSWLLDYVSVGQVLVLVIEGEGLVSKVRSLLGPTQPEKAAATSPSSLRARYGIFGGVNCAHASESKEASAEEVIRWKEKFALVTDPDAKRKVQEYIQKYIDYPMIDSMRYRELSEEITSKTMGPLEGKEAFQRLLRVENPTGDNTVINNLADVMVRNCLLPSR